MSRLRPDKPGFWDLSRQSGLRVVLPVWAALNTVPGTGVGKGGVRNEGCTGKGTWAHVLDRSVYFIT